MSRPHPVPDHVSDLAAVPTPALLLDRVKLDVNIARMAGHLARIGVSLRPHLKTAKNIDVARRVLDGQPGEITVSTLDEARYFVAHGIRDILYAVGIAPAKLPEIAALHKAGVDIAVILDDPQTAHAVADLARAYGIPIPVLVEIDSDGHRAGLRPDDPALCDTARIIADSSVAVFRGIMTHAGASYECRGVDALRAMARQEQSALTTAAARLAAAGLRCAVVSAGSTPTAVFAESAEGITEYRAGVYMFQDLVMAGLGVCGIDDIALSVLVTVIGRRPDKGLVLTDGGWMALSRDRGTAAQDVDQGYGVVCDVDGIPIDNLIMTGANQEHGVIAARDGSPLDPDDFPIGRLLRILPNHACATAAQHTAYHIVEEGYVVGTWQRLGRDGE